MLHILPMLHKSKVITSLKKLSFKIKSVGTRRVKNLGMH
jgi:hypothetical protein